MLQFVQYIFKYAYSIFIYSFFISPGTETAVLAIALQPPTPPHLTLPRPAFLKTRLQASSTGKRYHVLFGKSSLDAVASFNHTLGYQLAIPKSASMIHWANQPLLPRRISNHYQLAVSKNASMTHSVILLP